MVLFCASLFFGSGFGGELVASQAFSEFIGLAAYFNAFDLCHDCCHRVSVLSGATLGHLGMPALAQPAHLLGAALLFGLQFMIWMSYRHSRDSSPVDRIRSLKNQVSL